MFCKRVRSISIPYRSVVTAVLAAFALTGGLPSKAKAMKPVCKNGPQFGSTSYGPPWVGIQGTGVTALGVELRHNPRTFGVAADPKRLRLGSRVRIWPNPFGRRHSFKVFDTGGAIKGSRIDFYDWRGRKSQLSWGFRTVRVCTI